MIKLLIGGSPCTHWSIAQSKNRETEAVGIGWELFLNQVIAKEKFQPDYFLYENNWSASKEIKEQIQKKLNCKLMRINSSLVSAQKRDRFYVFNWNVEQPNGKGILLKDILETDEAWQEKSYCITATEYKGSNPKQTIQKHRRTMIAEPIRIGTIENNAKNQTVNDSKQYRVYSPNGKSVTLCGQGGGVGAKTGLYAVPTITHMVFDKPIYTVCDGKININGELYPIQLKDGQYIIRKLTPLECERLQTLPDGYTNCVSNTQRYKGLGNGWTADVIIHILQGILKDVPKNEKIVVLSMYDGIGTGRYCLDKMGFTNIEQHAYEIDKYAIQIAMKNYPDIIQHGDAFQLREENWKI